MPSTSVPKIDRTVPCAPTRSTSATRAWPGLVRAAGNALRADQVCDHVRDERGLAAALNHDAAKGKLVREHAGRDLGLSQQRSLTHPDRDRDPPERVKRLEEHTSELQSHSFI